MAIPVLICGRSGTGKSSSMRNFEHDEIALINVEGKPLPFKGKFDSKADTDNYKTIKELLFKTDKKSIVIDDFTYAMTNQFMRGKDAGGNKFDLFDAIATNPWELLEWVRSRLPEDKIVYFVMHEDYNDRGGVKPKTIGKMIDDKICLEGMFTIVFRAIVSDGQYLFQTHNISGDDCVKSPIGMFETDTVENDLKAIDEVIREFWELPALKGDK